MSRRFPRCSGGGRSSSASTRLSNRALPISVITYMKVRSSTIRLTWVLTLPQRRRHPNVWVDKDLFLGETVGADLVAIRIAQISGVGGWRKGTRTGFALIGTSIGKTRFMKLVHRIASW